MTSHIVGERVLVPEFEIVSNPTRRLSDMARMRGRVFERTLEEFDNDIRNDIIRSDIHYASWAEQAFGLITDSYQVRCHAESCPQTYEGYWIEPENQTRENCFYCGGSLVKKGDCLICEECDKR